MHMVTAESQLALANAEFNRGALGRARALLLPLLREPAISVDAEHVLAVVERRLGNYEAANQHFQSVLRSRPRDPHALNNYANCLRDAGMLEQAIRNYQSALDIAPDYLDALINLGLAQKRLGAVAAALSTLRRAVDMAPLSARAWHALGITLRERGELDAAAEALDACLKIAPDTGNALHARARIEAERGKRALPYYRRALRSMGSDPEVVIGHAIAQFEDNDAVGSIGSLKRLCDQRPDSVKAHVALAQIRWQCGDHDGFAESFDRAIEKHQHNLELYVACFGTLMRAGRYDQVLPRLSTARSSMDADDLLDRYEAVCASEAGDVDRAESAFERQRDSQDRGLEIARIRHYLRTGRAERAAEVAEQMTARPDGAEAWPYLSIAWRLLGDPRSAWLHGEGCFVRVIDTTYKSRQLQRLGEVLRRVHHGRIYPFDQSLRGGTQTDGNLFLHSDKDVRYLRKCIETCIGEYVRDLPRPDPTHPFLAQPRSFDFAGSYSVRLRAKGHHINHMHPDAWISCCFYVDTPDSIGCDVAKPAGWLIIGQAPDELGVNLEPLVAVRPMPGRVAIFPSIMWHGTRPFPSGERLTVVSDLLSRRTGSRYMGASM